MKSLQLRLGIGLLISLISLFIALWWLTSSSVRTLAEDFSASHLEHDAESILSALHLDTNNTFSLDNQQIEPVYRVPFSGQYFLVMVNQQVLRSPSLVDQDFTVPHLPDTVTKRLHAVGPKQQPLIIMAYGYSKQGQAITVAIAEDLSPSLAKINVFQYRYTAIALTLLLLLIIIQLYILQRGFHPLKKIQQQIQALQQGEIAQLDTNVPKEVSALVNEVNNLLKVLTQRLQRSRNALGDLAHALKTPLTVLQQLSREETLDLYPDLRDNLVTQTTTMQRMMDRVLKRARLSGSGSAMLKFDIEEEMLSLIHALKSMYRHKNLNIHFVAPAACTLLIDREDMLELTGNLLDNACKWAKSTVMLSIEIDQLIRLRVEDDGLGVSEKALASLVQRGTRLDETVNGHGLGLAIAQLITEQHGGQLILGRSTALDGFCATALLSTHSSE